MRRLLVIVALALVLLQGCSVNPVTGKRQLDLIGEAQEVELGKSIYPQAIQGSFGPIEDAATQDEVHRLGAALAAVGHRPNLPYEFTAVNEPDANAFALPGGKICITRGLLGRLESEDGAAAVLAHEIGHVTARHAVSQYNRQLLATALLVGGSAVMEAKDVRNRGVIALGAAVGLQLGLAHYSREMERQSDELGLEYAVKAGYSPYGMVETQKILLSLGNGSPGLVERMFASHPMSAERLATAEKRVAALPADVRERPLRKDPYRRALRTVLAEQPAWELAREGRSLLAKKQLGPAEQKLASAVRQAPKAGVIRALHAASLASNKRYQDAANEAQEGVRLAPNLFITRVIAGELQLKTDPRGALANLDVAESLLPEVAEVALMRGRALEALGQRQAAVEAYKQAYQRDPQGEVGAEAVKRLQALGVVASG